MTAKTDIKITGVHFATVRAPYLHLRTLAHFLIVFAQKLHPLGEFLAIKDTEIWKELRDGRIGDAKILVSEQGLNPVILQNIHRAGHLMQLAMSQDFLHTFGARVLANPTARIMAAALLTVSLYS